MFLALGIQDAVRMRHIVMCGQSVCTECFHIISQKVRLKKIFNIKCDFGFTLLLLDTFISHSENN
jgi:hypothetical protein